MLDSQALFDDTYLERRDCNPRTLEQVTSLAIALAREGREGRKVGAIFVVGDADEVLKRSRPLILDPLAGHPAAEKHVGDPNVRETLKELAQLDGAFIGANDGTVLSACRHLSASSDGIDLLFGLGTRHMAAASMTQQTEAVAVVVSESSMVRIFDNGELVSEIIPELWMMKHFNSQIQGETSHRTESQVTVVNKET